MARVPRSHALPEYGVFHVTARGVARMAIVLDDDDRIAFCGGLAEVTERFGWKLHAWCLLDNHFHLIVEAARDALSRGMHRLCFLYAQGFNGRHDRPGHLFQSRFHAKPVGDEEYLWAACRYVLENPLRAGICTRVGDSSGATGLERTRDGLGRPSSHWSGLG